jgi:ABC-type nitrate/sulfonate/bicarbonate transport system substrate-binding protein
MAGDIARQAIIAVWLCIPIAPAAADTVTLRYGQIPSTVRSVSALYLSIAQQKGFFDREEVKLDLIPIAGGTDKMIAALDQGTVDVTQTATPYLIRAVLSGSDAVAIAGETANPVYSLIVKPQIQHFAELKGKTLGLSLPVDTISISMRKLLALKGLGEADYTVKELIGTPVRFDCLKRGECDAVPLGQLGFRRYGGGLPEIRCVDGGSGGVPIPGRCRAAAGLGAGEQGRGRALRARSRRGVSVHPRSRKSRGGRNGNREIDRLL